MGDLEEELEEIFTAEPRLEIMAKEIPVTKMPEMVYDGSINFGKALTAKEIDYIA